MKITLTKPMLRDGVLLDPGTTIDLPNPQADFFVQGGWATAANEQPAPAAPDPEKAPTKRRSN